MLHKVRKRDCMEAINYFYTMNFLEQLKTDERHYVEILLRKVANHYKITLLNDNNKPL